MRLSEPRLLPGHACLCEPQTIGLLIRRCGGLEPADEYVVTSEQVAAAIRGELVYVGGGLLTITPWCAVAEEHSR